MRHPNADHEFALTYKGQTYSIAVYNVRDDGNGTLLYDVVVKDSNGAVVLADDYEVINPPIMVPDGTFREVVDKQGNVTHEANMVEDLVAAFEQDCCHTTAIRLQGLGR